jgi:TATA-binding protein-associated factor Taf7
LEFCTNTTLDKELDDETRILREEIADLEAKIEEKNVQLQGQTNPIMRQRFEGIIKKLKEELDKRKHQLSNARAGNA